MNMEEIFGKNPDEFSRRICEAGFYPEGVPPNFTVENFFVANSENSAANKYISTNPNESAIFNSSKRGWSRRIFKIPNPHFFSDSSVFFNEFRDQIFEHYCSSDCSLSVPRFSTVDRPVRITSHADFHQIRRQKLSTSRFIVRTDISRYFHSIYTHSLPWALHGKAESKKDRKPDSSEIFGNRLDQIVRQSQDGQTVGIPVGPDFSRYISEIIGKAIDREFIKNFGDEVVYIRHVDDIFIGSDDQDRAQQLLNGIRENIRKFELDINENKTSILPTNRDLEPYWPVTIRREIENFFESKTDKAISKHKTDLTYFLDQVVRIANDENDDAIIKYTLHKIDEVNIWSKFWDITEPFLIRAAINFPHCWEYVARIVSWNNLFSNVDKEVWQSVIEKSLKVHVFSGHDSETCWALWLAIELDIPISAQILEHIFNKCGALSCLIAVDAFISGKSKEKFPKTKLLERLGDAPMTGDSWLLSYECDNTFELSLKTKNAQKYPFAEALYKNGTSFYESGKFFSPLDVDDEGTANSSALAGIHTSYDDDIEVVDSEHPF